MSSTMKNELKLYTHNFLLIIVFTISILQSNLLGTVGLWIYGGLLILSLCSLIALRKKLFISFPLCICFAYFSWYILSSIINGSFINYGSTLFQLLFISLLGFANRPTDEIQRETILFAKIATIAGILMTILSYAITYLAITYPIVLNYLPQNLNVLSFPDRLVGLGNQPNVTARYIMVSAALSIFLIPNEQKKWNILAIINIILSLLTIFFATKSRTSMIAFLAFILCYCILFFKYINKDNVFYKRVFKYIVLACFFIIGIFLILITFSTQIRDFMLNDVIRVSSISTGTGRTGIYKKALELGQGKRLFGYNYHDLLNGIGSHNIFIQVLSDAGVPALVLFIFYFFYSLIISFQNVLNKKLGKQYKKLTSFIFCFLLMVLICGIAESVVVCTLELIAIYTHIFLAYSSVIHNNLNQNS